MTKMEVMEMLDEMEEETTRSVEMEEHTSELQSPWN